MSNERGPSENHLVRGSNSNKRLVFISIIYGAVVMVAAPLLSYLAVAHGLVPAARVEAIMLLLMMVFCIAFGLHFPRSRLEQGQEMTAAVAVGAGGALVLLACGLYLKVNLNGILLSALIVAASYFLIVCFGFAVRFNPSTEN